MEDRVSQSPYSTTVYCVECDLFFKKTKTGVTVALKSAKVRGDVFTCPGCHKIVYSDFGVPY